MEALPTIVSLLILPLTLLLIVNYSWLRKQMIIRKTYPHPPVASLLNGHLKYFMAQKVHRNFAEWAETYGGVFWTRNLTQMTLVISDPFLMQQIVEGERTGAIDKPMGLGTPTKHGKIERNLFSELTSHPLWKTVRKGVAPAFMPLNLRQYHPEVTAVVQRLIDGVKSKGPGTLIDVANLAQRESFDVIGVVGFGKDMGASRNIFDAGASDTFRLMGDFLTESVKRTLNPTRKYLTFLPSVRRGSAAIAGLERVINDLVAEVQARGPPKPGDMSIAAHLLRLSDPATGCPLERDRLAREFQVFFIAGSETTGHSIAWTLYFLTKHPAAMAKLEAELDQAGLLASPARPHPRQFVYADIGKLPYLDACIKESMRLQPVASQAVRRQVLRDVRLSDGRIIPKGAIVMCANFSMMRDPAWGWGSNAGDFVPERWEDPNAEYFVRDAKAGGSARSGKAGQAAMLHEKELEVDIGDSSETKAKRYTPFGNGIRNCVGMQLSKMNIPTAVAMIVSQFKLALSPEDDAKRLEDLEILRATLQPVDGLHMTCTPRV